ncbi:amidohydrolase family protein [Nocardioides sp.]|uniref:amidohydrolase family protein n=1 Tax=Nocardioides sp. TaxID=35761 RepID=UPI0039E64E27
MSGSRNSDSDGAFVIEAVTVFDGERVLSDPADVYVKGSEIAQVGPSVDVDASVRRIDGQALTLLPGLLDCHTHSANDATEIALRFGVTTELDMNSMPSWMDDLRRESRERDDVADVRSASTGGTVRGGHPTYLMPADHIQHFPYIDDAAMAERFVVDRIAEGADWIKVFIEDGTVTGAGPIPMVTPEIVRAVVAAAHAHGRMVVAHATALAAARTAVSCGVDGLVHIFIDEPAPEDLLDEIAEKDVFVVATLATLGSLSARRSGEHLADDPRVAPFLPEEWRDNLRHTWARTDREFHLEVAMETVRRLHDRGARVLAGSDAVRVKAGPGTAHGVSLHDELVLLTRAGLTPTEALRAATSLAADTFSLNDRGRIQPGKQADLLLVRGRPDVEIDSTLDIHKVWRRGVELDRRPARVG